MTGYKKEISIVAANAVVTQTNRGRGAHSRNPRFSEGIIEGLAEIGVFSIDDLRKPLSNQVAACFN